ncbi:argininosuccinate synthase-related protein [Paenibacillus sp. 102]|uniref:argininosuccinate synthase-related protein n=1 Tax=Paenibacillus sp. 102 TaxID=3120823 RepID=UPI0031B9D55B
MKKRIRSIENLRDVIKPGSRVLTLFSGGLDSAYLLHLLSKQRCKEVIALTVDLGDDVNYVDIQNLAKQFGAHSVILDKRQEFVEQFVAPAIAAHASYLGVHPISSSLSRPCIVNQAVRLAKELSCDVILHTANQSQNSLRRLNGALDQLGFKGYYGTPYEFSALTREEKINELRNQGVNVFQTRNYSGDSNLWCREFESGMLDDPEDFSTPEDLYRWSASKPTADATKMSISFKEGIPLSVNGQKMQLLELIEHLNVEAGIYGIGRFSGLEHLAGGEKVLEVREMPAAHILLHAYRQLETACVEAESIREKISLEQIWIREAVEGRWYGTLREAAQQFIGSIARNVTGTVTYHLDWRTLEVNSICASRPLYIRDRDGWEKQKSNENRVSTTTLI